MNDEALVVGDLRGYRLVDDEVNGDVWFPGGVPTSRVLVPEEGKPRFWTGKEWKYV